MKRKKIIIFSAIVVLALSGLFIYLLMIRPAPVPQKSSLLFIADFESRLEVVSYDYSSSKSFEILTDIDEACFSNEAITIYENSKSRSVTIYSMKVNNDFCLEPQNNKIILKMENIGNNIVVVSEWS
ncbi:MAG: hypothetical protein U9R08_06625 [Nanoarchaeota archaeon]|nr:hypothetical protein [Nanoarchaeota archaeon]